MSSSSSESLRTLKDIFPDIKESILLNALKVNDGNMEMAINSLVQIDTTIPSEPEFQYAPPQQQPHQPPPRYQHQPQPIFEPPPTIILTDEELAMKLQMEQDEIYARSFQSSPPNREIFDFGTLNDNLDTDSDENEDDHENENENDFVNGLLEVVKENFLPTLLSQIIQIEIPPISERSSGEFSFEIEQLKLEEAVIPKDKIEMALHGKEIRMVYNEVSAKLSKFVWRYEKGSFPKIKDNGTAEAAISNTKISIQMVFKVNPIKLLRKGDIYKLSNLNPTVNSCVVEIGNLDVKIADTKASFVYNLLLAAFKKSIRQGLETTLSETIKNSLNVM